MLQTGSLKSAFVAELRDMYDAERQLTKALPKLAKHASAPGLRAALESHLEETQTQIQRIESVFEQLEEKPRGKRCEGIAGIIEEGANTLTEDFDDDTMDAAIIAAGQRAEHYEIAAYGTLIAWARVLGHDRAAGLLEASLEEEKAADQKLSILAEAGINRAATRGSVTDEGAEDDADDADDTALAMGAMRTPPGRGGRR